MDVFASGYRFIPYVLFVILILPIMQDVQATIPCAEPICIGTPTITGTVINDTHFSANNEKISVGANHSCKLYGDGSVKCWGLNSTGQLGQGDLINRVGQESDITPNINNVNLGFGRTAIDIGVGSGHSCALLDNAMVKCWGAGTPQLGAGVRSHIGGAPGEMGDNLAAVDLGTGRSVVALAVAEQHNCVILNDNTVKCWGYGRQGQLGLENQLSIGDQGGMGDDLPIVNLGTGVYATQISAGDHFTCALLNNNSVKCWGYNDSGQLGVGDVQSRGDGIGEMGDDLLAIDFGTNSIITQLDSGGAHVCALFDDGKLKCWGDNDFGQLGYTAPNDAVKNHIGDHPGEIANNLAFVDLGVGRVATEISVERENTCARLDTGTVKCWGRNEYNRLRQGDITTSVAIEDSATFGFRREIFYSLDNGISWNNEDSINNKAYKNFLPFSEEVFYVKHDYLFRHNSAFNLLHLPEGAEFTVLDSGKKVVVYWVETTQSLQPEQVVKFRLYEADGTLLVRTMTSPSFPIDTAFPGTAKVVEVQGPVPSRDYIAVMWTVPSGFAGLSWIWAQDYYIDAIDLQSSTLPINSLPKQYSVYSVIGILPLSLNPIHIRCSSCAVNRNKLYGDGDKPFLVVPNSAPYPDLYPDVHGDFRLLFERYHYYTGPPPELLLHQSGGLPGGSYDYYRANLIKEKIGHVNAWVEDNRIKIQRVVYNVIEDEFFLPILSPTIGKYKKPILHSLPSGGYVLVYQIQYNDTSTSYRGTKPVDIYYRVFDVNGLETTLGDKLIFQEPRFNNGDDPNLMQKLLLTAASYVDDIQTPTVNDNPSVESFSSLQPNAGYSNNYFDKTTTAHELNPHVVSLDGDNFVIQFHTVYYPDGISYNMPGNKLNNVTLMNSFFTVVDNTTNLVHLDGRQWSDCRYGVSVLDSCTHYGDYISQIENLGDGNLLVGLRGGAFANTENKAPYASKFVTIPIEKFKPNPTHTLEQTLSGLTKDIYLQYKVVDLDTGVEYFSPVKSLLYASPSSGTGSISYVDGFTNRDVIDVSVELGCDSCDVLRIEQRIATLSSGVCGVFSAWQPLAGTSPLDRVRTIALEDGRCYQFKATALNTSLGVFNEYTSQSTVKVDQIAPSLRVVSSQLVQDTLSLDMEIIDANAGVASQSYRVNEGALTPFSTALITTTVRQGSNQIYVEATDQAGNLGALTHFVNADLDIAQINIIGIEEGGEYASDLTLLYTFTQALTEVVVRVDGVPRTDLVGLPEGPHTLEITGVDAGGNSVRQSVSFTINRKAFSFQLLAPQNRDYATNDLRLQYAANKNLSGVRYTLNGGAAQTNPALSNLADGNYVMVVTATSADKEVVEQTVRFSVKDAYPSLTVTSPIDGQIYPSNTVALNFASDSVVQLQLDGVNIANKATLTFSEDGSHTLIVTAQQAESGNHTSQVIHFATDTVSPEVSLLTPESRIYTSTDIPIDYTSNKTLTNIVYTLDGSPVQSLNALKPGRHVFKLSANDRAGRDIQLTASFEVAALEIVTPQQNERVISTVFPPLLDFQYQASGNFTSYTLALDDAQANLLRKEQGPGSTIPLVMAPGPHEITLRGAINQQQVGKRRNFAIGTKNIAVAAGSINYSYANCDNNIQNCEVTVQLKIRNIGAYDIDEPIPIRLDHSNGSGYESFWFTIPALASKTETLLTAPVFTASLGDALTVNVDPNATIGNELVKDNIYRELFSAGKIISVTPAFPSTNRYIEQVSLFNPVRVLTAGPIDRVQYHVNGWTFEDTAADGDFSAIIDMGLLSKEQPCVTIKALSATGTTLDSNLTCFDIVELNVAGLSKYTYDWTAQQATPKQVIVNSLDRKNMLTQLALARRNIMRSAAAVVPAVDLSGNVNYKFYFDPGAIANRVEESLVRWANDGFIGGGVGLPNGQAMVVSTIDPSRGTCNVDGAISIKRDDRIEAMDERYAREILAINQSLLLVNALDPEQFQALAALDGGNFDFENIASIPIGSKILNLLASYLNSAPDAGRGTGPFGGDDLLSALFDINFNVVAWVDGDIPESLGTFSLRGNYVNRFVGEQCVLFNLARLQFGVHIEGYYDWGVEGFSANLVTNGFSIDAMAYSYVGWGIGIPATDIGFGFHIPLLLFDIHLSVDAVDINVPIEFGARQGIKIKGLNVPEFGPLHSWFNLSINHHQRLARADATVYPALLALINPLFIGLGYGEEYEAKLNLDAEAKIDYISTGILSNQFFNYVDYDFSMDLYKRSKICFFSFCYHDSWKYASRPWSRPAAGEIVPFGVNYQRQDVDSVLQTINAPWLP